MDALLEYIEKYKSDVSGKHSLLTENNDNPIVLHADGTDIYVDISKNTLSMAAYNGLFDLAHASNLEQKIKALAAGKEVNRTEHRAANHMTLRCLKYTHYDEQGRNISEDVFRVIKKMEKVCWQLETHLWRGFSNKPITDIVSIGIGGSHLAPKMAANALKPYWRQALTCHYLSNIDGSNFTETMRDLNADTTLFIIQSKSFSTQETLKNTDACRQWFFSNGGRNADVKRHFLAVTANIEGANEYGIDPDNIFPVWDWVGGRYSLWSAMGLPLCLTIGFEYFKSLLDGAWSMDQHFISTDLKRNLPVNLALLGIYYRNVIGAQTQVVLPYDHYLRALPAHLQQLDMESNGKSVTQDGHAICYATGPVVWGGVGSNGQHAYHQLLHQGTEICPCDFILPLKTHNPVDEFHSILVANCLSQSQALMRGRTEAEAYTLLLNSGKSEAEAKRLAPHHSIPGNRPSNMLYFEKLTPKALGSLIALYEHKVFVQGVIWDINSFDQWGVELGKRLSTEVLASMKEGKTEHLDASTAYLVNKFIAAQSRA
jgi:glucose-6-phosphate isomerase